MDNMTKWITELIRSGDEVKFYKCGAWLDLRNKILDDFHYECQECLKKGKITRAKAVHHINELKKRPDLALNEFYIDPQTGETKRNLVPLCQDCHNEAHDRICGTDNKFQNVERW